MATYRTIDGDTIDAVVWGHYGSLTGTLERVLDANQGLADLGPVLPIGTLIHLPELASVPEELLPQLRRESRTTKLRKSVKLWD